MNKSLKIWAVGGIFLLCLLIILLFINYKFNKMEDNLERKISPYHSDTLSPVKDNFYVENITSSLQSDNYSGFPITETASRSVLEIQKVEYNTALRQLSVIYKSTSDITLYFKGTFTLINDVDRQKIGDLKSFSIAPHGSETRSYSINIQEREGFVVDAYILFGEMESSNSHDQILRGEYNISYSNKI